MEEKRHLASRHGWLFFLLTPFCQSCHPHGGGEAGIQSLFLALPVTPAKGGLADEGFLTVWYIKPDLSSKINLT